MIKEVMESEKIKMASMNDFSASSSRRSSSRSIKRKKFDDELVESSISLPKQGRTDRIRTPSTSMAPGIGLIGGPVTSVGGGKGANIGISLTGSSVSGSLPVTPGVSSLTGGPSSLHSPLTVAIPASMPSSVISEPVNKRPPKPLSSINKRRRHRQAHNNAVKDIGRWKAQDDLALMLAVQQTNNLEDVYRGVKFSCKFTLKEIENRWYALLYDPTIAKISVSSIRQLHTDVVALIHRKTIFSQQEEDILKTIPSTALPGVEVFDEILSKHTHVFLPYRTGKCLFNHWALLKHHHLLSDQSIQYFSRHQDLMNFSDGEDSIEKDVEASLGLPCKQDDLLHAEHILSDRKNKREIRKLENEIPRWQVLVDSITGVAPSDFDNHTLAVLRGRLVRYLMRSREITLGRCTKDSEVDVNLSLEGPAAKISRKQGLIKLQPNGDFMLANTGKRPIYVDSKPIIGSLNCAKLFNNSVVEIAGLRFVFLINQDLIAAVRAEALKSQI